MSQRRRRWAVDIAMLVSWLAVFMIGRNLVDGETLPHLVPLGLEWVLVVLYVTWALLVHGRGRSAE